MKKLKYMFWFILIGFLVVLVYQNIAFFSSLHSLHINLGFYENSTPELSTGAIIAIFVGFSVLFMMMFYFASRFENYRVKKTIRELKAGMQESAETISKLTAEVEMLKAGGNGASLTETPEDETDMQNGKGNAPEAETTPTTQA
jgi:sensor histidine kinase YesM